MCRSRYEIEKLFIEKTRFRRMIGVMKQMTDSRIRDGSALFGIVAGFALLIPGFLSPEMRVLIVPGFALLLPSLLYTMR